MGSQAPVPAPKDYDETNEVPSPAAPPGRTRDELLTLACLRHGCKPALAEWVERLSKSITSIKD